MKLPINIDRTKIEAFCKRWKIIEFSFFGSILRDDFGPDSDVDVLVEFSHNADWKLEEKWDALEELSEIIGRRVGLNERCEIGRSSNLICRSEILNTAQQYYTCNTVSRSIST
ncbi:nucleotidyltransferase domain-containing protein [bacterium]|nr:nucleotidyltransferase domain-containing protein [bacterium]